MDYNRTLWIIIFFLGTFTFLWMERHSENIDVMAWFLLTSLWSAACAIAYTIIDWFLTRPNNTDVNQ